LDQKIYEACKRKHNGEDSRSWNELAGIYEYISGEALRSHFKRERKNRGEFVSEDDGNLDYRESEEIKSDGTIISDKLIQIVESESKNPTNLLIVHGFDPDIFELCSCKNNLWHGIKSNKQGGGRLIMYQSKIVVKPKKSITWNIDFIDKLFENLSKKDLKCQSKLSNIKVVENGKILLVGISDFHLGLLSTNLSSGVEYNLDIAEKIYLETIDKILDIIKGQQFEKIVIAVGNDFLNSDNLRGETQGSTRQDNATLWFDLIDKGIELIIKTIDAFLRIAKVDVIYVPSNHDLESIFSIMRAINLYYHSNSNVSVDYSPKSTKYYQFGKNLLGFSHNIDVKRALEIFTTEAKDMWSSSEHMFWFLAHLHKAMIYEKKGYLEIIRLPALSGNSRWATNDKNFVQTERKAQCFIIDKEDGIINTINIVV
jgi:hypothetical protein